MSDTDRKVDFLSFAADHPVFRLADLAQARGDGERLGPAQEQLKHYVRRGRVLNVARGVYAAVPPGIEAGAFTPDPFLVAAAARPDGIFCYHSAFELLGQAHSVWNELTLHCKSRRAALQLGEVEIVFLAMPAAIRRTGKLQLGTQAVLRGETRLTTTGPERTLVEAFRQPHRCGGLDEVIESVSGFPLLEFDLLTTVLESYDERGLWAAVGWLSEREVERWRTPGGFLDRCRREKPQQPQYLLRNHRGGTLLTDWNLIVPRHLLREFEGHDSDA